MKFLFDLWSNDLLVSAAFGWLSAQIIKTVLHTVLTRSFKAERLVGAGGMPSSHSATVCALTTSAGVTFGIASPEFAICAIIAFICMYDAMGVRRETGNQAQVINKMIESFQRMSDEEMSDEEKLKEFIGHTPIQVFVGAVLGILVGFLVCGLRGLL